MTCPDIKWAITSNFINFLSSCQEWTKTILLAFIIWSLLAHILIMDSRFLNNRSKFLVCSFSSLLFLCRWFTWCEEWDTSSFLLFWILAELVRKLFSSNQNQEYIKNLNLLNQFTCVGLGTVKNFFKLFPENTIKHLFFP